MKLKIALTATALLLTPSLGLAEGCSYGKQKQAMSCAEGSNYDSTTHSCLPVNT